MHFPYLLAASAVSTLTTIALRLRKCVRSGWNADMVAELIGDTVALAIQITVICTQS